MRFGGGKRRTSCAVMHWCDRFQKLYSWIDRSLLQAPAGPGSYLHPARWEKVSLILIFPNPYLSDRSLEGGQSMTTQQTVAARIRELCKQRGITPNGLAYLSAHISPLTKKKLRQLMPFARATMQSSFAIRSAIIGANTDFLLAS